MANNDNSTIGCFTFISLIFVIPLVVDLINTIINGIAQLIEILVPVALIGAAGYGIYMLIQYNRRTRKIEILFEKIFNMEDIGNNTKLLGGKQAKGLEAPKGDTIVEDIEVIKEQINEVKQENEQIKANRKKDINDAVRQVAVEIDQQNKKSILNDIFAKPSDDYSRSDEFEKQEHQNKVSKTNEDLENRSLQLEVNKQLFEQDKRIYENYQEAKEDRYKIRIEMNEGFTQISQELLNLDKKLITLQGYMTEKFNQLEIRFIQEISQVKETISNLRVEVKEDMADMKIQFGREIVRLDKQQIQIIGKLEEYSNKVKAYSYEMIKCKNDCERLHNRGEAMLQRANNMYHHHQADIKVLSKDLNIGLQQMALHDASFSNKVGQAKIMIDAKSQDINFALKDMGYERIGINMLRQEHDQRNALEHQKMQNLVSQQRHLEEKIRSEESRDREVTGLRHQLNMTNENLQYTRNRAGLMQQEFNVIRRLSR